MAKRNNRKYKVEKRKVIKSQNVKFQTPRVKNLASRLENKGKEK